MLRYSLETDKAWVEVQAEPGETSHALENLRCGSTYRVQVAAVNLVGRGEPSHTVNTRTRGAGGRLRVLCVLRVLWVSLFRV